MAEGLAIAGASLLIVDIRMRKATETAKNINDLYKCNAIPIEANVTDQKSLVDVLNLAIKNFSKSTY